MKTMKRPLHDNTGPGGDLKNNSFSRVILQYRNTPDEDSPLSHALCTFDRKIRDLFPGLSEKYRPYRTWRASLEARENALRSRHMQANKRMSKHSRRLTPLQVGDHVHLQNQIGSEPLQWDTTGVIVEVRPYDLYMVKVDGSNRTTLRNWKFLRKFLPTAVSASPKSDCQDHNHLRELPRPVITQSNPIFCTSLGTCQGTTPAITPVVVLQPENQSVRAPLSLDLKFSNMKVFE